MSASESTPPEQPVSRVFSGASGVTLAVLAACLFFGGCVLCGGALSLPLFLQRQRRAEEAARRAQAVENLKQIGRLTQQENAEQSPAMGESQAGGDSPEPLETE